MLSRVRLFATVAHQSPLSMGFSRQECWSGLPFSLPRDLRKPEIKPRSSALQVDSLLSELPGKVRGSISKDQSFNFPWLPVHPPSLTSGQAGSDFLYWQCCDLRISRLLTVPGQNIKLTLDFLPKSIRCCPAIEEVLSFLNGTPVLCLFLKSMLVLMLIFGEGTIISKF